MVKTKQKTKKPLTEAQKAGLAKKKKEAAFRRKIKTTFTDAGFSYLSSNGKEFKIGCRAVELDYLFIYDNVILICEDTCSRKKDKDHIRNKSESFQEIEKLYNQHTISFMLRKSIKPGQYITIYVRL